MSWLPEKILGANYRSARSSYPFEAKTGYYQEDESLSGHLGRIGLSPGIGICHPSSLSVSVFRALLVVRLTIVVGLG